MARIPEKHEAKIMESVDHRRLYTNSIIDKLPLKMRFSVLRLLNPHIERELEQMHTQEPNNIQLAVLLTTEPHLVFGRYGNKLVGLEPTILCSKQAITSIQYESGTPDDDKYATFSSTNELGSSFINHVNTEPPEEEFQYADYGGRVKNAAWGYIALAVQGCFVNEKKPMQLPRRKSRR